MVTSLTGVFGHLGRCLSREGDWILVYNQAQQSNSIQLLPESLVKGSPAIHHCEDCFIISIFGLMY